jgi:phage terminase large subunit GpA-like protein
MNILQKTIGNIFSSIELNNEYLTPSQWIEKNRYVQKAVSSRLEGMYNFDNTPYMREIVDHLSVYSPVTHVVIEKGVRIGATFALVHNGVPYIISERPENTLLVSATKDLARETMEGVDFGIDGAKIRNLLGKGTGVQNNSKGDTANYKSFSGGYKLFNAGGQSDTEFRQITVGIMFIDEVDAMKFVSSTSGAVTELFEDRAKTYGEAKKIVYISSPLLEQTSVIHAKYLEGDQNKFLLPCPKCGEFIELVWNERNINNTRYGVIFDIKKNQVVKDSVRYRCGKCENEFQEKKYKMDMLNSGYWNPTMETLNPNYKSYHISALYAPTSMDNWYDFAVAYQKAFPRNGIKDDGNYQHFVNSILGKPYKKEGIVIKSTELQKNRRDYKIGECPFELSKKDNNGEIMIISLSADLGGYNNDVDHGDDARIDYEILAHSESGCTYSIDAGSCGTFLPNVELRALKKEGVDVDKLQRERKKYSYKLGVDNSVWDILERKIEKTYGKWDKKVTIIAIDVGSFSEYAMEFVKRMRQKGYLILAIMGANEDIFESKSRVDKAKIYQMSERGDVVLLNVNVIKNRLAKYIATESYVDENGEMHQPAHHMNFPEYDPKIKKYTYRNYFAHYEAEVIKEKKKEGQDTKFLWEKRRPDSQNHFLDVAVYNQFCAIYMTDLICSNGNSFKVKHYGTKPIESTWDNMCRLIRESSELSNIPLS